MDRPTMAPKAPKFRDRGRQTALSALISAEVGVARSLAERGLVQFGVSPLTKREAYRFLWDVIRESLPQHADAIAAIEAELLRAGPSEDGWIVFAYALEGLSPKDAR